jgi:kynurenine formamidase
MTPRYKDLPVDDRFPPRSSWGVFGADDEVGTVNRLGAAQVRQAAGLVRTGQVFALNWSLDLPRPPLFDRETMRHTVFGLDPAGSDDYYDSFYPQASTHWDALSHIEHLEHGYYQGRTERDVRDPKRPRNGIEHWARRGIVGRYVLADVERWRSAQGRPIDPASRAPITIDEVEETLGWERTTLGSGDILLLRFGWIGWYERSSQEVRESLANGIFFPSPGLAAEEATAAWLWDKEIAAVAGDVPALEATPFDESSEEGFLHYRLLPLLGFAIGEMFALDAVAAASADDGVYEGLFTSAPLNKAGGSGSPANALAVR